MTCPTCGRPVPEGQRFCGNCGTDVQAATTFSASQNQAASSASPASPTPAPSPYYDPGAYDYVQTESRPSWGLTIIVVVVVAIFCCCCGLAFGWLGGYLVGPPPNFFPGTPATTPTPTPASLMLLFHV